MMRGTGHRSGLRLLGLVAVSAMVVAVLNTWALAEGAKVTPALKPVLKSDASVMKAGAIAPPLDPGELMVGPANFTIEGLNFETSAALSTSLFRYPEPNGAVGPNHLVAIVNGAITWHTKAGVLQGSVGLMRSADPLVSSFFASLSPSSSGATPRVIYDEYSERFVVMVNDRTSTTSAILLAVSDDSDPNGTWYFYKVNTAITVDTASCFAFYPAISVGPDAIFITAIFYGFSDSASKGSRLIIVQKAPFYTGGAAVVNIYDPSTAAGFPYQVLDLSPVQMVGTPPEGLVTFLVSPGWYASDGSDYFAVIEVDGTSDAPTFPPDYSGFLALAGDVSSEEFGYTASQKGTTYTLDVGWPGCDALLRNNNLWFTFTHAPTTGPDVGQATVHWVRWGILTNELEEGDVGGEELGTGTCTYYPSLAVNSQDSMAISFMASGPNLYPGAYFTGRLATDAAGQTDAPRVLAAGVDYYYRVFGSADAYNTLGWCSSTGVDAATDTFWTFNGYALARGSVLSQYPTQDGRWGTRWGSFAITGAPGDFNLDGYVNAVDLARFQNCVTGPAVPYAVVLPAECDFLPDPQARIAPDFDRDGDVDLSDWGIIQRCFDPSAPVTLNCAD